MQGGWSRAVFSSAQRQDKRQWHKRTQEVLSDPWEVLPCRALAEAAHRGAAASSLDISVQVFTSAPRSGCPFCSAAWARWARSPCQPRPVVTLWLKSIQKGLAKGKRERERKEQRCFLLHFLLYFFQPLVLSESKCFFKKVMEPVPGLPGAAPPASAALA